MAYQFDGSNPVPTEVRRVVTERIDEAIVSLEDRGGDRHKAVHDARKRFKEIRAVLRLVRGEIGEALFREENSWFAGSGRELSAVRDAQAMIETIEKNRESFEEALGGERYQRIRRALVRRRGRIAGAEHDFEAHVSELAIALRDARRRVESWPLTHDSFGAFEAGLTRTYRNARRAFRNASRDASVEHVHEWRKRVKDQWYHSQLLRELWPEIMKGLQKILEDLSRTLGDVHDLDVLDALAQSEPRAFGGLALRPVVAAVIATRRSMLLAHADEIARRLYVEKPRAQVRRLRQYWDARNRGEQVSMEP